MTLRSRQKWSPKLTALMFCLGIMACGSDPQPTSALSSGSWGGDVGGTLLEFKPATVKSTFKEAEFYWVQKPTGFGVIHEYLGVVIYTDDGEEDVYLSGLVADDDEEYFLSVTGDLTPFSTIDSYQDFSRFHALQKRYFTASWYNNGLIFGASMVSTPINGRPCANVVRLLKSMIRRITKAETNSDAIKKKAV